MHAVSEPTWSSPGLRPRPRSWEPRGRSTSSTDARSPPPTIPRRCDPIADYEDRFNNPYVAAELGLVDEVIEPRETRYKLIRALDVLRTKRETLPPKKHGNGPQ